MAGTAGVHRFEVFECGDPYSSAWDVSEFADFEDDTCTYRGDLSGMWGREELIRRLKRYYPGCEIRER